MARDIWKLSTKEQKFVDEIIAGEGDAEAYRRSYTCDTWNNANIRKAAFVVRHRPRVSKAIEDARGKASNQADITVQTLLDELDEARLVAAAEKQGSAMTAATMGKARLLGLDKKIVVLEDAESLTPWDSVSAGVDK